MVVLGLVVIISDPDPDPDLDPGTLPVCEVDLSG
jgi:hypothetical protein